MIAVRSEAERTAAVEAIARRKWDELQATFPKFTRQRWEDGSEFARAEILARAEREYVTSYHRTKASQ